MLGLIKLYRFVREKALILVCLPYAASCQSGGEPINLQDSTPNFALRLGEKVELGQDWGSRYEVYVEAQAGDKKSRLAFYGYDLNGDGRFEFVDQIDEGGQVIRRGYDLDFDGDLDTVEPANLK